MKHTLIGEEALRAFNKTAQNTLSKLEQEEFDKKIQQVAADMLLSVKKCVLSSLPDLVRKSNSRLYMNEIDMVPEPSPTKKKKKPKGEEDDYTNQFFKDIYQVTCEEDGSSFFVMKNGLGSRMVSDHWTEESIDKCAEMVAKLGGGHHMIPLGEPGAFPAHLRAYATQAYAKHGIHLPDPTPQTTEEIKVSKQKYELFSMKEGLAAMRQKGHNSDESANNEAKVTPLSITSKPY